MARGEGLRHGYTTGACAAVAAKGAVKQLFGKGEGAVALRLPWGKEDAAPVVFALTEIRTGTHWASCGVIKDGGDDPDATHGMEIRATVIREDSTPGVSRIDHSDPTGYPHTEVNEPVEVIIDGGEGVGRVTRRGLAPPVGEAAINPVPRAMIEAAVREGLSEMGISERLKLKVVVSAPEGVERARRTMNERLGVVGGISILGTTGIVIPMSTAAWTATIDACLDVAKAAGSTRALLAQGRTSERAGQALFPELAGNAAVLMGDHVGYALDAAANRGMEPVIVGQFAKFCKVAAGNYATHVKDSTLNLDFVRKMLLGAGFDAEQAQLASSANTAREVYEWLQENGDRGVFRLLTHMVARRAATRVGDRTVVEAVLFGYKGECLAQIRLEPEDGPEEKVLH
jgi:cobalt-precorrin-5B (C1)-methyltransferase